ncbi:TolC family protein [Pseudobacter ginsenosidimutans]|uniref:Outer membrane protein TolC n=1 Tax=Pseudobacter ginsenosidimutans TaxID=661488 RepID=A0A4Q7MRN9_9BACT|nr:TolC family protein [Pseudobacter ginsenosidimutans]QEC41776.1 TolC family protein [Pseudobacter ginsenosidimutans]RZS71415.1 outer membrane protein TolC [Pseudobacter ginsenosidimutans]
MNPYQVARRSSTTLIMFLAGFALPSTLMAQNRHEMSVQQCVEYASKNSVTVKNALVDIQIQQQTNKEITAQALPNVSGNIETIHYPKVPVQSFPNFIAQGTYGVLVAEGVRKGNGDPITAPEDFGLIAAPFGTKWNASAGVSLNQILFDGQVFIGLQARETSIQWATRNAEVTMELIKANVYKVYWQIVIGRKQMETFDANIERLDKTLSDTRAIYQQGLVEKLDVDKLEVSITNLRTEKMKVENSLKIGLMGLKFLIGMPSKDELVLTDTLSEEKLKENILDDSYKYEDRKEFQYLQLGKKLNEFNVKRYQLSRIPTVSAFGTFSKNAMRDKFNFFNDGEWFTTAFVGVRISVPIFEGFAKNARVAKARLELQKTQNQEELLKLNIDNEVDTARIKIGNALLTMESQKKNMELAESIFNQAKLKYDQGLGSNLEITNAQTELKNAQVNYYAALFDAVIARIDYLRAIGKL